MTNGVSAIVPVFQPDRDLTHRLEVLASQVDIVVVVDDGSEPPIKAPSIPNVQLIRQANAGIAKALNTGIHWILAESKDCKYILTVDQDSELPDRYVETCLIYAQEANSDNIRLAAITAGSYNSRCVRAHHLTGRYETSLEVAQSGMLFPLRIFEKVGIFREDLIIDVVETEWLLRAGLAGYSAIVARGADLKHSVGESFPIIFCGMQLKRDGHTVTVSYHSPLRRYYITRNRLIVFRQYFRTDWRWIVANELREWRTVCLSFMYGPRRPLQILGAILGIRDGLRGSLGRPDPRVERLLGG